MSYVVPAIWCESHLMSGGTIRSKACFPQDWLVVRGDQIITHYVAVVSELISVASPEVVNFDNLL